MEIDQVPIHALLTRNLITETPHTESFTHYEMRFMQRFVQNHPHMVDMIEEELTSIVISNRMFQCQIPKVILKIANLLHSHAEEHAEESVNIANLVSFVFQTMMADNWFGLTTTENAILKIMVQCSLDLLNARHISTAQRGPLVLCCWPDATW